ncbi:MAG: hypothetical protein HY707_13225 [Ignavibacteriae bacterium]|nr:hypothetical protein [Ignavibacteriota bacterium]
MNKVRKSTYFMAHLKDKPGALLKVMRDLKARNISLLGLWGFGTGKGKADLFVVAKNPARLRKYWKASRMLAEEGTGFFITGTDRTGALLEDLKALANARINIHAIDAIAAGGRFDSFVWVEASKVKKAAKALKAK